MDVVLYPDPVLRLRGKPITEFDASLRATAEQMIEKMYEHTGVGLAAPQVGLQLRLFVFNPAGSKEDTSDERAFCNPQILSKKTLEWGEEGCLSIPEIYGEVERHTKIVVRYQDLDGKEHEESLTDFPARVFQHEHDHVEGILFIDRLSAGDKIRVRKKLEKLEESYQTSPRR